MAAGSTRTWKDAQRVRRDDRVEGKRENKKKKGIRENTYEVSLGQGEQY